ncbi:MAG: sigma-70 family RNA polymerase sigma factor [Oscillospiraceae bacterium]|nr:sigma-70 family RNA polymerase sigma factor [Oscillospiraceae bacterium]
MTVGGGLELLEAAQRGDREAGERMLLENSGLIWSVVRGFYGRGLETEDLYQIACVGFIKAVQGFNFTYGTQFSTYAVPKIAGEIRRFLRDDGTVKVARGLREQAQKIYAARESLRSKMQREPTLTELAEYTGLGVEEIAYAEIAVSAPESLQQENAEGLTLESLLGTDSPEEQMVESIALRQAVTMLPEQERMTVALRFYRGFTQAKTARVLKVSQVQVSRLERRAMQHLREILQTEE